MTGGAGTFRTHSKGLWQGLFELERSVWCAVLPYCVLNCTIMIAVDVLAMYHVPIAFSPAGHGLMALIVSFLVISKVNLTYNRYMECRHATGHALAALRELNQTALILTVQRCRASPAAMQWREKVTAKIIDLIDCTIRVIKDENQTVYLARNEPVEKRTDEDPMIHVQALRSHLFNGNVVDDHDHNKNDEIDQKNSGATSQSHDTVVVNDFQLLERVTLLNMLNDYVHEYRNLLKLASTPIPFPLIQMARTFLFLWTFTIPLVLRGVVSDGEAVAALVFVFFLTYGFIGLELVAMKLMYPFGDEVNDLNVSGMREATLIGIANDLQLLGANDELISDRRASYSLSKAKLPSVSFQHHHHHHHHRTIPGTTGAAGGGVVKGGSGTVMADPGGGSLESIHEYHSMSAHNVGHFT